MEKLIEHAKNIQATPIMQEALAKFEALGVPTKKLESWKYTNPGTLLAANCELAKGSIIDIDYSKYVLDNNAVIVFMNGQYQSELSKLPAGISIEMSEKSLLDSDNADAFELYNSAVTEMALNITVEKNKVIKAPVTILHLQSEEMTNKMINPRIFCNIGEFAEVSFHETFRHAGKSNPSYTINALVEFKVATGAKVEHIKSQVDSLEALHIGKLKAIVSKDASFNSFTFSVGAKLSRNNMHVQLAESGAETAVHGLYALRGEQHSDQFSIIDHLKSHTNSAQLFKGVLDNNSHGVFTGKVMVHRDAQQINSEQLNKNILLSKKAHINTRPILEIYADDVKCAHGATIGQIDPEQVFYLESRGIPRAQANEMLCHGFAQETIDTIKHDDIRKELSRLLISKYERYIELTAGSSDD